jgi:hypothetical protein
VMDVVDVIAVMSVYFPWHAYASHESCAMLHPPALRFSHHTCYFVVDKVDVSERLPAAYATRIPDCSTAGWFYRCMLILKYLLYLVVSTSHVKYIFV